MAPTDTASKQAVGGGAADTAGRGAPRRPMALVVVGILVVLVVAATVLMLVERSSPPSPKSDAYPVGAHVAGFSIPRVDGAGTVVAPWVAHHAAVVMFFSKWCPTCAAEVARVARAVGTGDVGGVRFVGVDGDRSSSAAGSFVSASGVRFPVGHDPLLVVTSKLAPGSYPATLFVGADGHVAAVDYGVVSDMQLSVGLSKLR